ncbi:SigE family RNA polymerase sigma factor [Pedococcus sp. 5OH_020]|uniref:SigE family RNA polymerase sigma factor n=1 Tax=Pedococcus sp. 5OH_020 TaxID=2989814 RepID=UPI0022E99A1D|nr:SigE family RNA polymerase sigma factor [Pedococcus sp. 5OH_020]
MSEVTAMAPTAPGPSFEEYVAARGASLLHTAWLLTGDHHRAEDLVQTALGKTWPRWAHIAVSGEGSYDGYVRKVMVTTYISWWRRRWTAEYPTATLPERPVGSWSSGQGVEAAALDSRRDLMAALAQLPRGQRAVVVLRYFHDLSEAQTAQTLGCSVGTVKSQTSRALATLRTSRALAQEGGV